MRTNRVYRDVNAIRLRKLIASHPNHRVFISRDGEPERELDRRASDEIRTVRIRRGLSVDAEGAMGFYLLMEMLYRWMRRANVLIEPDGIIRINFYSK